MSNMRDIIEGIKEAYVLRWPNGEPKNRNGIGMVIHLLEDLPTKRLENKGERRETIEACCAYLIAEIQKIDRDA